MLFVVERLMTFMFFGDLTYERAPLIYPVRKGHREKIQKIPKNMNVSRSSYGSIFVREKLVGKVSERERKLEKESVKVHESSRKFKVL